MLSKPFTFDRVVRILVTIGIFAGIFWLLYNLQSVLLPFFLALLVAYLINPIVLWWEKLVKKRWLAILITLLIFTVVSTGIILLVLPALADEATNFVNLLSKYSADFEVPIWMETDMFNLLQKEFGDMDYREFLSQDGVSDAAGEVATSVWNLVVSVFGFLGSLLGLVTFTLYFVFILIDYESIAQGWQQFIPERFRGRVVTLFKDVEKGMAQYFKAQTKIVLIVAILFSIGFKLIGLPMAIFLGITVGLLNYVPYLQVAGLIPAIFLALIKSMETGSSFWVILGLVLLVFAVVQLIQDAILVPKIMGNTMQMHPAVMLLALSIWGSWLGVVGMIIALPLTTLAIAYYREFVLKHDVKGIGEDKVKMEPEKNGQEEE